MVVACISLFVALGGASYAAVTLPRNSVGTPQLKKNAVVSAKVRNGSLKALDFAAGQLPAGPQGPQGPPGPTAAAVSSGEQSPPGPGGSVELATATIETTVPGNLFVTAQITATSSTGNGAWVACHAVGPCSITFGIYVDGDPVDGTWRSLSAGASATAQVPVILLYGVARNVPAGTHAVELRLTANGNVLSSSASNPQVQAIAIG